MKLGAAKRRYAGEWIAFRFSDPAREEGRVLCHGEERFRVFEKLGSRRRIPSGVYVTFSGPVLPKDVGIVLILKP